MGRIQRFAIQPKTRDWDGGFAWDWDRIEQKDQSAPEKGITVEDIHNDFKSTAEAVVAETEKILGDKPEMPVKPEILERYESLGLKRNKNVKKFESISAEYFDLMNRFREKEQIIQVINYYRVKYPANPFIPHENLLELCKKYGLVFDRAEYFTEDIPLDCLEAMEKFELKEEDSKKFPDATGEVISTEEMVQSIANFHKNVQRLAVGGVVGTEESGIPRKKASAKLKKSFHIVGTKEMFDLPMGRSFGQKSFTSELDDPIVLQEVSKGWLLIAAWGPEAELPEINIHKQ